MGNNSGSHAAAKGQASAAGGGGVGQQGVAQNSASSSSSSHSKQQGQQQQSWHTLIQDCAMIKGAVFAIRGDSSIGSNNQGGDPPKLFWGRSRMGKGFAAACRCGAQSVPNQDSFFFVEFAGRDFVMGVMDGYGPDGHKYSDLLSWHLPLQLIGNEQFPHNVPEALAATVATVASSVRSQLGVKRRDKDQTPSGAACAVIVRVGAAVYTVSIGETQVVLYDSNSSQILSKHRLDGTGASNHATNGGAGGMTLQRSTSSNSLKGNNRKDERSPKNRRTGRSHGGMLDDLHDESLDLKIYPLNTGVKYAVVVGSDGLWEALSLEDVRKFVWGAEMQTTLAVQECVSLAVRRWTHGLEDPSVGVPDITCAIAAFILDPREQREDRTSIGPNVMSLTGGTVSADRPSVRSRNGSVGIGQPRRTRRAPSRNDVDFPSGGGQAKPDM
mmetsp:Transcript_28593/g.62200  ORF Transcript_28593/g.62200 Transcript_28593/m.62200 type:complete len:441 (-) Transcript_28593:38-1360(-)